MRKWLVLSVLSCLSFFVMSQELNWNIRFNHFFDNTEFAGSPFQIPQTMAGLHVVPEVILGRDTSQSLTIGVDLLKEYGSDPFIDKAWPEAYYAYRDNSWRLLVGSFPRSGLLDDMPRAFFRDSITYYRPYMTGMCVQYTVEPVNLLLFLDWTGRKTRVNHESFFVGGMFSVGSPACHLDWEGLLFHHAASGEDPGVHENSLHHLAFASHLTNTGWLKQVDISLGYLGGLERNRELTGKWIFRHGFLGSLSLSKWIFECENTLYVGDGLMSDYPLYGSVTYWGDPFYRGSMYNRTDFSCHILHSNNVWLDLTFSNHLSEGKWYVEQLMKGQSATAINAATSVLKSRAFWLKRRYRLLKDVYHVWGKINYRSLRI